MMTERTIRGAEPAPSLRAADNRTGSKLSDVNCSALYLTRLF